MCETQRLTNFFLKSTINLNHLLQYLAVMLNLQDILQWRLSTLFSVLINLMPRSLSQRLVTKATSRWPKLLITLGTGLLGCRSKKSKDSKNLGKYAFFLRHGAKHRIVTTDAGSMLIIVSFGVTHCIEFRLKIEIQVTMLNQWNYFPLNKASDCG